MRLDRYIANASGLSRRQVHRLIRTGDVLVNGTAARNSTAVAESDCVTLYGDAVTPAHHVYIALHKPSGYICATMDADHPTVLDLLGHNQETFHPTEPLQVVGRLDIDTTGLVLVTTDGQWNHRVTSPNGNCHKTYEVSLAQAITQEDIHKLEQGVLLRSESKPTRPCVIRAHNPTQVTIELREGKYHQVKRMFAAMGNRVTQLHRSAIGAIQLDASLPAGSFRPLTAAEIDSIQ